MTVPQDALVFDTGPLRHFAAQGWLGVLKFLAGTRPVYVPDTVRRELDNSATYAPGIGQALDGSWITVYSSTDLAFLRAFADYENLLVVGGKNLGECGVLAMGKTYGCRVVIDDRVPREIAKADGLDVTATVPLLCEAIRHKQLTTLMVESLCDDLLEGVYHLPFSKGGFRRHVIDNGLLDYDEL